MPGSVPSTGQNRYPGNRLGMPADGPGSVAGWGRRVPALFADWVVAGLVASLVLREPLWSGSNALTGGQLLAFFVMTAVLTGFAGATIGHRICGLQLARVGTEGALPGPIGPLPCLVRTALVCLVIPAMVYDRDYRGLHDRAAGTIVVRR